MLLSPYSNQPYRPTIYHFLGGFDVYDREEILGGELNKYDPNDKDDREFLIRKYCVNRVVGASYRHLYALVKVLDDACSDRNYDFSSVLEHNSEEYFSMPWEWDIKNPRAFFEDILRIAKETWREELQKASQEDQSKW